MKMRWQGIELYLFLPPKRCPGLDNVVAFQAVGERHLVTLTGSATNSSHNKSYASVTMRKRIVASSRSQGAALG